MTSPTPGDFLAAPVKASNGNTPWASAMAREIRDVVTRAANRAPRSQQVHLGPSELGVACDRQVVGKLVGEPRTNHVTDPWPSVVGTAVHSWLADAFDLDNQMRDQQRWFTEQRVTPHPDHAGTADLYDAHEFSVDDHKVLGESSMAKVRSEAGPGRKYRVQLFLYALGYARLGVRVDRVALFAYPRTGSSLDGVYVWETPFGNDAMALLTEVFEQTAQRKVFAEHVRSGGWTMDMVPRTPDRDECYFCPFYRPESGHDGGQGCPGTVVA